MRTDKIAKALMSLYRSAWLKAAQSQGLPSRTNLVSNLAKLILTIKNPPKNPAMEQMMGNISRLSGGLASQAGGMPSMPKEEMMKIIASTVKK